MIAAQGIIKLDACRGLNGLAEGCELVTNASACTTAPCERLVVIFSGGEQGCEKKGYGDVLAGYAATGQWAAVCINYFETSDGSGAVPYLDEQVRIDLALREATTGAWAQRYWTGSQLLLQGVSHGATAPVIAMARSTLDEQPHWHGTFKTAACFFDGSYNQFATAEHLRTGTAGGMACTVPVAYTRWLERYCGPGATTASCNLQTQSQSISDSISQVPAEQFAIKHFRLVECGSAMPVCTADILPAPPIEELCTHLDAEPQHHCQFSSLPTQSHLNCHTQSWGACRTWFDTIVP